MKYTVLMFLSCQAFEYVAWKTGTHWATTMLLLRKYRYCNAWELSNKQGEVRDEKITTLQFILISAFVMHISYVLTSAANSNISLPAADVWCSQLPVLESVLRVSRAFHKSAHGIIVLLKTPTVSLLLTAKVLIWGLRAANLTLCTY